MFAKSVYGKGLIPLAIFAITTIISFCTIPFFAEGIGSINIISPLNQTYATPIISFNVSLDDNGSWCGFSLDGAANTTMYKLNNTYFNYTGAVSEGSHGVVFHCNDSVGNMNSTTARYFFISEIEISQCRTLGTSGVTYKLNQSVEANETCFTTGANNVTLDCLGNTIIYGIITGESYGVVSDKNHVKIRNCTISSGAEASVDFWGSITSGILIYLEENQIENVNVSYNKFGISLWGASNTTLMNITANFNSAYGIVLRNSSNITLANTNMSGNTLANFYITGIDNDNFNNNIDTTNIIDYSYIMYYNYSISDYTFDPTTAPNAGAVYCLVCNNVTIKDLDLSHKNSNGIFFFNTNNSRIENVITNNNIFGINLTRSSNNVLDNITANGNLRGGITLGDKSNNNTIRNLNACNVSHFYYDPPFLINLELEARNNLIENAYLNKSSGYGIILTDLETTTGPRNNIFKDIRMENLIDNNTLSAQETLDAVYNMFHELMEHDGINIENLIN